MNQIFKGILICSLIALTACVSAGKMWSKQTGVVLDAETQQPIEGVIVVARWIGIISQLVDSQTTCYHVESAMADTRGRYQIPAWTKFPGKVHHETINFTVYKPGYRYVRVDRATGDLYLRKDVGSMMERLAYMRSISHVGSCGPEKKRRDKTLVFYESLYQEAISITASSPKDAEISKYIDGFEHDLNVVKYGWDVADQKRMEKFKRLDKNDKPSVIIFPGKAETIYMR